MFERRPTKSVPAHRGAFGPTRSALCRVMPLLAGLAVAAASHDFVPARPVAAMPSGVAPVEAHGGGCKVGEAPGRLAPADVVPADQPAVAHLGGECHAAVAHGGRLWLGCGPRLVAVDTTVPAAPRAVGQSVPLLGLVEDIDFAPTEPGDPMVAWVVLGPGGLAAVDVSDIGRPRLVGRAALPAPVRRIAVVDARGWVVTDGGTVWEVDLRDPARPVLVAFDPLGDVTNVTDLAVLGESLVVAVNPPGGGMPAEVRLYAIGDGAGTPDGADLTSRAALAVPRVGEWVASAHMAVDGDRIWLLALASGAAAGGGRSGHVFGVDAADPDRPTIVADHPLAIGDSSPLGGGGPLYHPRGLAVGGGRAYVAGHTALGHLERDVVLALDVRDPSATAPVGAADLTLLPGLFPGGVAVVGDVGWVVLPEGGVRGMAVLPGGRVTAVGGLTPGGPRATTLSPSNRHLFSDAGVYDVSDPAAPRAVARLRCDGGVAVVGDLAACTQYRLADDVYQGQLRTFDVADPTAPKALGSCALGSAAQPTWLAASEGRAAVGIVDRGESPKPGIRLVDLAERAAPRQAVLLASPDVYHHGVLDGHRLVVTGNTGAEAPFWLRVLEVADADRPVLVGSADLDPGRHYPGAWVASSTVALAGEHAEYAVVASSLRFSVTYGGYAGELLIVDLSDPGQPRLLGDLFLGAVPHAVAAHAGTAYVGLGPTDRTPFQAAGIAVIDIRDPARPSLLDVLSTATSPLALARVDGHLYAGAGDAGLYVFGVEVVPPAPPTPTATEAPTVRPTRTAGSMPTPHGSATATAAMTAPRTATSTATRTPGATGTGNDIVTLTPGAGGTMPPPDATGTAVANLRHTLYVPMAWRARP